MVSRKLERRYGCACGRGLAHASALTDVQFDVLKLIASGRDLAEYVPRYRTAPKAQRGAYPVTIASRAAMALRSKGFVSVDHASPSGFVLTRAGVDALTPVTIH